jgi:hypothetical protein
MSRVKNVSDKICRENHNTHYKYIKKKNSENRAVYEKTLENMVQREKPHITI